MLHDPTKDYDEVGQTFIKMANYIEEHGHCKGDYTNPETGSVCALGAVNVVICENAFPTHCDEARRGLIDQCEIELHKKTPFSSIVDWNDDPDQTKEGVIKTFREIAEDHKLVKVG